MTIAETFDQLVTDWKGKKLKVLTPGYECFDVAVKFTDMLNVPHAPGHPSPFPYDVAYKIYTQFGDFQAKYFEKIPNGLTNTPMKGDIVVWSSTYNGGPGHVAVASGKGNALTFEVFSQNDPLGSVCVLKTYAFGWPSKVLGWLRPKPVEPDYKTLYISEKAKTDEIRKILNK